MARTQQDKRDKGYGKRRRQSLASRHEKHTVKVHSCPLCYPGAKEKNNG